MELYGFLRRSQDSFASFHLPESGSVLFFVGLASYIGYSGISQNVFQFDIPLPQPGESGVVALQQNLGVSLESDGLLRTCSYYSDQGFWDWLVDVSQGIFPEWTSFHAEGSVVVCLPDRSCFVFNGVSREVRIYLQPLQELQTLLAFLGFSNDTVGIVNIK